MARAKSRENEMNGNSRSCAATQKLVNCVNTADAQHSLCMRRMGEHRITTIQLNGTKEVDVEQKLGSGSEGKLTVPRRD